MAACDMNVRAKFTMESESDTSPNAASPHVESMTMRAMPMMSMEETFATVRTMPSFMDRSVSRAAVLKGTELALTKSRPFQSR